MLGGGGSYSVSPYKQHQS
jgi:hypothetical protein